MIKFQEKNIWANYLDGGLKICNFEKSLKLSWIKCMANQDKTD